MSEGGWGAGNCLANERRDTFSFIERHYPRIRTREHALGGHVTVPWYDVEVNVWH